jgi:hypothetical protein
MEDYEKLGAFYLGCTYDPRSRTMGSLLLLDSRDLTTHAVVIGMTGSGKTGLGITLLEEAAMDGIPVIAIDPKGDIGNLLLSFPSLDATALRPWINPSDAMARGMDEETFAHHEAQRMRKGLAEWGQSPERIGRMRRQAELAIYTPGAPSGRPLSILSSFDAPSAALLEDPTALAERIRNAASSLLGLLGIEADPLQSREHILLSTIFHHAWSAGRSVDLAALVQAIRSPPFSRLGVMDVETFYPSKARFELALRLNGLLASPGFGAWLAGEPLDIHSLLYTPDGRPRVSVLSIAHLPDSERMFFVTLLLGELLSWMKSQPGTTSLRALLYMDEIFGYFPPTAAPPSKAPMLTLLKQARAFGLGLILATQNPVDLDYKGLSNAGTWFIGRLQTERDKMRVLEALEGSLTADSGVRRKDLDAILSGLAQRSFLLHSVHADAPLVFVTRWTLSYLRGPLTLAQIRTLTRPSAPVLAPGLPPPPPPAPPPPSYGRPGLSGARPVLPPGIPQLFEPLRRIRGARYAPAVLGAARVRHVQPKTGVDVETTLRLVAPPGNGAPDWTRARPLAVDLTELCPDPEEGVPFAACPSEMSLPSNFTRWEKDFTRSLQQEAVLVLYESPHYKLTSRPEEGLTAFRLRVEQARREARDIATDKLREKYATRLSSLKERLRRAEHKVETQAAQASQKKLDTAVSMSLGMFGAFFGRRSVASSAGQAIRNAGRAVKEDRDVDRAREEMVSLHAQIREIEDKLRAEVTALRASTEEDLKELRIRPKATDIRLERFVLLWSAELDSP